MIELDKVIALFSGAESEKEKKRTQLSVALGYQEDSTEKVEEPEVAGEETPEANEGGSRDEIMFGELV